MWCGVTLGWVVCLMWWILTLCCAVLCCAVLRACSLAYTRGGQGEKVERLYREVRAYAIPGGSEEIMLGTARRLLLPPFFAAADSVPLLCWVAFTDLGIRQAIKKPAAKL